jgi:hypothetical protein
MVPHFSQQHFVFSARYVVQRALEMLPRIFETRRILIGLQIRVDEFDEAIEVFGCDLHIVSIERIRLGHWTHSIVLLVKVVNVSVEDLDKQLDRHCCIHACISNTERTLQTFKHAFAIAVELWLSVNISKIIVYVTHSFRILLTQCSDFSCPPQMTRKVNRTTLIWLLEQLASVQRTLCYQSIIVLLSKISCRMQSACDDAHRLELCS